MDCSLEAGTNVHTNGGPVDDDGAQAIDIDELTAAVAAVGRVTGEFGDCEAMVVAGRVVVVLAYRQFLHAHAVVDLHAVVHHVLVLADYPASAQTYEALHGAPIRTDVDRPVGMSDEVPMVIHRSGHVEPFDPSTLATSFYAAGHAFGEYDDDEPLRLAGRVARILGLRRRPGAAVTTVELEDVIEDLLIDAGYVLTARGMCGAAAIAFDGDVSPVEEAVGSFLSSLERAA